MARNKAIEERVKALVAELLADEEAEGLNAKGQNINDIEEAMVRIGDLVAREFGVQKLAAHMSRPPQEPQCPDCGQAGEHQGERTRHVITRRGEVPLTEAKYRCPKCRRLFFPSDDRAGA
jgi:Zn finger protein HypA/HybF involved in hydrogenase expression